MESSSNVNIANNGDKSLAEWPTLSDVCSNVKQNQQNGGMSKNARNDQKRTNSPTEKVEGYDSSKENEDSSHSSNGRGARKKGSRLKWVPVPIAPPPYRKRGNGRSAYEANRGNTIVNDEKKTENHENTNGTDNSRSRGTNRTRGKRGRGFTQSWRQRREETSRGEIETNGNTDHPFDVDYFPTVMYFDPFVHKCYASVAREKELKKAIRNQIEYYFSEENLMKDFFMRRKMDKLGYVPLTLVAGFHRVQNLTKDFTTIVKAVDESDKLEVVDGIKIRPVVDPLRWPLPDYDNRIFELRTDVPEFIPGQPYVSAVVEGMQRMSFYSDDASVANPMFAEQYIPNGCPDQYTNGMIEPNIHFDSMTQNTPLEATG